MNPAVLADAVPGDGFTWMALLAGTVSLLLGYRVDFAHADRHPLWRFVLAPLRPLEAKWVAGGRARYFGQVGWVLVALGALGLFRDLLA